jgi:hypothetical protein
MIFVAFVLVPAFATQNNIISDLNVQVTLNYPDIVKQGNDFVLSSIVKATADQVSNITITISSPEVEFSQNSFHIDKLAKDSTLGNNFNGIVKQETPDGTFLANVEVNYFVKGYLDSHPVKNSITQAIQLNAESKPILLVDIQAPSDVFAGEPFSIKGTITNQGVNAQNIQLTLVSSEMELSGKKLFSLTNLDSGKTADFEFVVQTQKEIETPTHATIHVNGTYSDDSSKMYHIDNSLSIFARQRGMLEIGDANGIWLGNFFIAPVVGVGTIVSSVIGLLIFAWHYKNKKKTRKSKK